MSPGLPSGLALAAAVVGLTVAASAAPARAQSLEDSVKANYLVRFAAFVTWPAGVFSDPDSPVVICVLGEDRFGSAIDRAAASQFVEGHPIVVRRPSSADTAAACHILYMGRQASSPALDLQGRTGQLVVTDEAVSGRRGAIHFVVAEGRVRFHIDQQISRRNGLVISSRLLNLALSVRGS